VDHGSTKNRLLVSVPATGDTNFDQSVVYVIDHDDDGAIGVILNRPGEEGVPEQVDIGVPEASPAVLFEGGPVSPGAMIILGRRHLVGEGRGIAAVGGVVAVVTAAAVEGRDVSGVDLVRVYSGYAGWAPRQLDAELAAGVWVVVDALPDDVFCSDPERLWRAVLAREGGRLAAMARYPSEPGLN
jgi:putative transcriptional regulator